MGFGQSKQTGDEEAVEERGDQPIVQNAQDNGDAPAAPAAGENSDNEDPPPLPYDVTIQACRDHVREGLSEDTGKPIFSCNFCPNVYGSMAKACKHLQNVHSTTREARTCKICHYECSSLGKLDTHLAAAHDNVCPECQKVFKTCNSLNVHMDTKVCRKSSDEEED